MITKRNFDDRTIIFENVPEIGSVQVVFMEPRTVNNPTEKPWFLCGMGTYHASPEEALAYFQKRWDEPSDTRDEESQYARWEERMISPGVFEED